MYYWVIKNQTPIKIYKKIQQSDFAGLFSKIKLLSELSR